MIYIDNGWITGDWHLILIDIFHEQPPHETGGVFGFGFGLLGIKIGLVIHHDK